MKQPGIIKTPIGIMPLEKRLMLDASLPVIADQVLWLDGADAATILDADGDNADDGTGGNNDGFSGSVATWQDKSGSGYDVSASGSASPLYGNDTQNGNGVLTFDGSDDRLVGSGTIAGGEVTMFAVFQRDSITSRDGVMELGGGSGQGGRNILFIENDNTVDYYNGSFYTASGSFATGAYHMAAYTHGGTDVNGRMNGGDIISASVNNTRVTTNNITIGDDATSGDEMRGTIAEVLVYDRVLTADEIHDIENYLATKWNLTIPNADPSLDSNTSLTLDEAQTQTITNTHLASSDTDNDDGRLRYTITDAADHGALQNTNTASTLGLGDSFTQSDIDNGYITYTHDGGLDSADSFQFDLSDGYGTVAAQTFNLTINQLGTLADLNGISNPVFHYDAQDIDADGDTGDQPADGASVGAVGNPTGTGDTASSGGASQPSYIEDGFGVGIGGLQFDGSNDYLGIPNDSAINTGSYSEKSFAFVFRTGSDISGTQFIYEQGGGSNGYNLIIDGGHLYAYVWAESYWSGADRFKAIDLGAVSANTTYTVQMIHDATGATLDDRTFAANVNGGAFTTLTRADVQGGHSGGVELGRSGDSQLPISNSNYGTAGYFKGLIGEVWCWNHALDATEISNIQNYFEDRWFDSGHSIDTNTAIDAPEDGIIAITNSYLDTNDAESADDRITYTLTSLAAQGDMRLSGSILGIGDTFTQDDINNGLVTYDHDGTPAPGADSFDFTVTDGFNAAISGTFSFNITAVPAADPVLINNDSLTLNEGASVTIASAQLDTNDGDTADTAIIYTVTGDVTYGTLYRNGVALAVNDTFTQDDINNSLITYTHDDSEYFTDYFTFSVTDGSTTLSPFSVNFTMTPVNDQTPSDIALSSTNVNENSSNGTVIGTLSATDADLPGDSFTYSIVADPDGKFQISGSQLRVGGSLNREAATSHSVTIRVSDGTYTYDEVFSITVNDVNENPTDLIISNTSIDENSANGTVIGTLSATDPDLPGDSFSYSITSDPDGKFQIVGDELRVNGGLDYEDSTSHNVTIRVSDGSGGQRTESYTITINDVNEVPVISATNTSVAQGQEVTLDLTALSAADEDASDNDADIIYTVTALPSEGELRLNGTALAVNDTFLQSDISAGNVTYAHNDASATDQDSFSFTVSDGALTSAAGSLDIFMTPSKVQLNDQTLDEGATDQIDNTELQYKAQDQNWYDSSWQYRQKITIDSSRIDTDLTDYSLLITEAGMNADFWTNVNASGSDIVVTMADGTTVLDRELVSIDTGGQGLQLYTRTDISSSTDTELFIYYGNAGAAESNSATTWRSEFTGVWHFDDDFADGNVADSSQSNNDAFTRGGFNNTNSVAGQIGQAGQFNNSEYLALDYAYSGNNSLPEISVSAWINTTDNSGSQNSNWAVIDFDRSEFFNVYIHGNGNVSFSTMANGSSTQDQYAASTDVNDGSWQHIAAVYDGTDKILYLNGVEVDRVTNAHGGRDLGRGTRYGFIGDGSEASGFDASRNNLYYDGMFDNIRMYEGTMSETWIETDYLSQTSPNTLYTAGTQEQENGSVSYTLTDLPDNGTLFIDNVTGNGTLDAGEALAANDTFTQDDIDNGLLYYVHDGGETTSDQIAFTVQDALGATSVTQYLDFTINPVNDAPTNIALDNLSIGENEAVGRSIGTLSASDVDLPGDSFTYSIISDPDNKFAIVGDQLQIAQGLDYETKTSHVVDIQVDDNNGGTYTRSFTILVEDGPEGAYIAPPEDALIGGNAPRDDGRNQGLGRAIYKTTLDRLPEDEMRRHILSATFAGQGQQSMAFYGIGGFLQPLRQNLMMAGIGADALNTPAATDQEAPYEARRSGDENAGNMRVTETDQNTDEGRPALPSHYTNLRDALLFLQQQDGVAGVNRGDAAGADNPQAAGQTADQIEAERRRNLPLSALEQKFEDVMTYHQKRQSDLRTALMG